MKKKLLSVLVAVFSLALLVVGPVSAAAELPKKITVGLMTGFQPYCWQNDDGSVDGFDTVIILGVELDFLVVPWESLLTSLDADKCQVVSSQLWRTPERLSQYTMGTVPYLEIGGQLLVKADNTDITSLASLNGREIGTTVGDAWTTYLEKYNERNNNVLKLKYYSEDISTIIQDVAAGRTAATLNETVVMLSKVEALNLKNEVKVVGELEGAGFCYLAFQQSDSGRALRDAFDKVYLEMIEDGTITRICQEWFKTDLTGNLRNNIAVE